MARSVKTNEGQSVLWITDEMGRRLFPVAKNAIGELADEIKLPAPAMEGVLTTMRAQPSANVLTTMRAQPSAGVLTTMRAQPSAGVLTTMRAQSTAGVLTTMRAQASQH